jgi:hypothetical protein
MSVAHNNNSNYENENDEMLVASNDESNPILIAQYRNDPSIRAHYYRSHNMNMNRNGNATTSLNVNNTNEDPSPVVNMNRVNTNNPTKLNGGKARKSRRSRRQRKSRRRSSRTRERK